MVRRNRPVSMAGLPFKKRVADARSLSQSRKSDIRNLLKRRHHVL
jgi:hypothetical protein